MTTIYRIWSPFVRTFFCGLFIAGLIVFVSIKIYSVFNSEEPQIDILDPNAQSLLCGPKSMSTALCRLGIPIVLKNLTDKILITKKGISMSELVKLASYVKEVNAQEKTLTWDELIALDGTAVLFVNNNHFVTADPREKESSVEGEEPRIRIYDEEKPTNWFTRDELNAIWNGDSIVFQCKQNKVGKNPKIKWEHCLIDAGSFNPDDTIEYRFNFRNAGNTDLIINSIGKSCNCASFKASSRVIPSGHSGWIEGIVQPVGRRGKYKSFLLVKTNDPDYNETVLIMESLIRNEHILSKEVVYVGQIFQGEEKINEIIIHDLGEKMLEVLDAQVILDISDSQRDYIQSSLELYKIEQDSNYIGKIGAYPIEVGDYLVRLKNNIHIDCFTGSFTGKILINTNLKSPNNHFEIPVNGKIAHHVHSIPAAVMLVNGFDEKKQPVICLQSRINKHFEVQKVWADNNEYIDIKPLSEHEGKPRYEVAMLPSIKNSSKSLIQTIVHFQLNNDVVLDVPVMIVQNNGNTK